MGVSTGGASSKIAGSATVAWAAIRESACIPTPVKKFVGGSGVVAVAVAATESGTYADMRRRKASTLEFSEARNSTWSWVGALGGSTRRRLIPVAGGDVMGSGRALGSWVPWPAERRAKGKSNGREELVNWLAKSGGGLRRVTVGPPPAAGVVATWSACCTWRAAFGAWGTVSQWRLCRVAAARWANDMAQAHPL